MTVVFLRRQGSLGSPTMTEELADWLDAHDQNSRLLRIELSIFGVASVEFKDPEDATVLKLKFGCYTT